VNGRDDLHEALGVDRHQRGRRASTGVLCGGDATSQGLPEDGLEERRADDGARPAVLASAEAGMGSRPRAHYVAMLDAA
jgi:hypothetical protein